MIQSQLKQSIIVAMQKAFPKLKAPNFDLEIPENSEFGDYSTNIAMQIKTGNPNEIAQKIVGKIKKPSFISDVQVKNGFINFYISPKYLRENLEAILKQGDDYGQSEIGKGKNVVIDYSGPNIAKPFSVGHLRSTIIGQAVYNLYKKVGYKVIGDNHLGDWGTQYGKLLYGISEWGKLEKIAQDPIPELLKLYIRFHKEAEKNHELENEGRKWFKRLEQGDEEAKILWQESVDWSFKYFDKIYSLLGVKIDNTLGESFYSDKMQPVIEELAAKNMLKESEGAKIVEFASDKIPPAIIVKSDGATTYMTRDLATIKYRLEQWKPDKIIYHIGNEQSLYLKQLFEIAKMLGWTKKTELIHAGHGLIRFNKGKMSTRKGKVILAEDIIKEAKERVEKLVGTVPVRGQSPQPPYPDGLIQTIAIGAIKYNDLAHNRRKDIIFDWDKVLNMEGDSGPYLQYTYARIQGLFREAIKKDIVRASEASRELLQRSDGHRIESKNNKEHPLARHLTHFSETIIKSAQTQMPNTLCDYLYKLASLYNNYYNSTRIIDEKQKNETLSRLALSQAVRQVLKNGLNLLGIAVVDKM